MRPRFVPPMCLRPNRSVSRVPADFSRLNISARDIEVSESDPIDNIIMMHNSLIVKFISFIIEITFIMHLIAEVDRLAKSN